MKFFSSTGSISISGQFNVKICLYSIKSPILRRKISNFLGKKLLSLGEKIIARIPLVKAIYNPIKQILEAIFSMEAKSFRRVVLIEYPRKGIFTMAFVTGVARGEIQAKTKHNVLNVFVPTTPNPTSGFYLMVPDEEVTELDLTVEEAFRLIVSGGMASK